MPQRVAFAYFGEDCEKQSVSNVLPYGVVCTCSFGPPEKAGPHILREFLGPIKYTLITGGR